MAGSTIFRRLRPQPIDPREPHGVIRWHGPGLMAVGTLSVCQGECDDCLRAAQRTNQSAAAKRFWGLKSGTGQASPKGKQNGHPQR